MPGTPSMDQNQQDTSRWGVRYNQQYGHQHQPSIHSQQNAPPPLPPRPASAFEFSQVQMQNPPQQQQPQWQQPVQTSQPYYPPNQGINVPEYPPVQPPPPPQSWQQQPAPDPNYGVNQGVPPQPPPLPSAYQAEIQRPASAWQTAPIYSQHPPTHQYDPPPPDSNLQQPLPPATQAPAASLAPAISPLSARASIATSTPPPTTVTTAPTKTATTTDTSASALGFGGPSDWEHYTATGEEVDDTAAFGLSTETPVKKTNTFELPSDPSPRLPMSNAQVASQQPARVSSLAQVSPEQPPRSNSHVISPVESNNQRAQNQTGNLFGRLDSVSSFGSGTPVDAKAIDGVIEVWSQPVAAAGSQQSSYSEPKQHQRSNTVSTFEYPRVSTPISHIHASPQQQSPMRSVSGADSRPIQSIVTISDPYEDLDPWYKSSLTRYVTMLRKEMETESEEEKYKLFSAFMHKESKLRAIMYNVENFLDQPPAKSESTPVPAPAPAPAPAPTPVPAVTPATPGPNVNDAPTQSQAAPSRIVIPDPPTPSEQDDVVSYSPGGLPRLASALTNQMRKGSGSDGLHRSASNPARSQGQAGGAKNPVTHLGIASHANPSRSVSVPPESAVRPEKNPAYTVEPPHAVYTPFRYNADPRRASVSAPPSRPAYQGYSALRLASVESGRVMAQPSLQTPPSFPSERSASRAEHDETFLGLIREKSVAYRGHRPGTSLANRPALPKKGVSSATFDELQALVPGPPPRLESTSRVAMIRDEIDNFPQDFTFIEKTHGAWDNSAASRQEQVNTQRQARQAESESHIDSLFNDKEIGYSDINVLEDEFKQTEAQIQLNEERKEFEKYVEIVFTRVDERLAAEIKRLQHLYNETTVLLQPEGGKASSLAKFQLTHAMRNAVDIFQKLEIRHAKRVAGVLERERRRKKAERRYYVFLGETAALKQMDKDFTALEQRTLLDAAKAKDDRTNKLMDIFDDASMRGIGENQRLLDDISAKINKFDTDLIRTTPSLVPTSGSKILQNTLEFVKFLGANSESVLESFGVADRLLNNADYDVSVAEAKVAESNADIFRRLEEEKKKEDKKIEDDLQARMSSVRTSHHAIIMNIEEVLEAVEQAVSSGAGTSLTPPSGSDSRSRTTSLSGGIGASDTPPALGVGVSTPPSTSTMSAEEQQQERLRKALEDAKRRNAEKGHT
ncbi:proline-rich protein HaeIII subfamily 1 [Arthroderma uncinatum]|uniref:proline-rich protein HaeIII subfamily 1 n=1 Tax=Arthroderma uncinatum TaxID=74035 RepID=UPI00144A8A41|nr:proline-rich protein HaeIII subfamily 1 [Arthroderma uncinatum]KAF3481774.1 proline-rich protein HaeIII subfamily 1 [Arthroderma uncinatum]